MQAAWKDDSAVEKYLNDCMFAAMEQMKSNYTKMCSSKDLAGNQPGHLAAKVIDALTEIAADPERGAFFASSLLHSVSGIGLIDRMESYIYAAYEGLMTSRSCYEWKIKDLKESKRVLYEGNRLNRRSRSASYCIAEQQLFHCEFQIHLYETLTTLLEEFRCQLVDISKKFFDTLQRTINDLIDTFEENQQFLEWNNLAQRSSNGTNIIEISDVQKKLDAYLNNINWSGMIQQFMLELLKHSEEWINQNKNVIAKFVTDFCSREFDSCVDMGLDRYLRDKYQTVAGPILINYIDHNEIERTISASSPLFDLNALQADHADLTYLFVPVRSKLAQHAAVVRQQARPMVHIWGSTQQYRIQTMRI